MTKRDPSAALPAKLTVPKLENVVSRTRLFKRLDMAWEKSVIWIGAPAGSGKTTLIASYLAQRNLKPLWYRIDARDADPAAFFAYLRIAANHQSPRKQELLPLLTPEYALGLPVFTLNFFDLLFSRSRTPTVLVLDNYQDLITDSPLHELLPQTIAAMREDMKSIFISRTDLHTNFAPLQAARRVAQFTAEEIMLRTDEAIDLGRHLVKDISDGRIEMLNRFANGWIAGLILLLEGSDDTPLEKEINSSVFDYFASEVMRRTDRDTQAFLVKSALLPIMDADSSAALTGNPAAEHIFKDLLRRNYFINRLAGEVMRYEFHPLFRDFLLDELTQRTSTEELRTLRRKAGRILLSHAEHTAAVDLLAHADATEDLIDLVLGHAQRLVAEGKFHTLEQWLQTIPSDVYDTQPWLYYWFGISRMPYDLNAAKDYFESAYTAFYSADDATGCYMSWAGIAECFNLMWDDYGGMIPWLDAYRQLRQRYARHPSAEVETRVQAALFGVLIFLRPQDPDCNGARQVVELLLLDANNADFRIRMLANLSLYYAWAGAFADLRRVVETGERIIRDEMVSPLSRIMVKIHRGTLSWITGEPEHAHEVLSDALEIAEQSGVHLLDSYILAQSVYASGAQNDAQAMLVTLERIKTYLSPRRRIDMAHYSGQLAWYKELSNDLDGALVEASHVVALLETLSAQMPIALGRYCKGKVLVLTAQYEQAHELFTQGLQFCREMPSKHLEVTGLMLRAYSWQIQENTEACKTDLKAAMAIAAAEQDYWTFPFCDHKMLSHLCAFALQQGIEVDYANALVRKWRLLPPEGMYAFESWPWPIRIHTLGRFSLLVNDAKVPPKGKSLEMLKILIALGGRDAHFQAIGDLLWPDAEGDQSQQNLKTTLHRLRKIIGQQALQLNEGKLTLDPKRVWVDIWAFDRLLTALESSPDDQLEPRVTQVIDRYRGGILPGETHSWLQAAQERLRNRFLRIVGQAAERLCDLGQWHSAIDCYRKALEIDPLAERFYIGLMRCHHQLGQIAEGLTVYTRCREILKTELQVSPSAETEQWFALLRQA